MDIGDKVIAVVCEPYRDIESGTFCTLKPMVDQNCEAVDSSEFYNRGRIWWKLRYEDKSIADPGRLLNVELEDAPSFDKSDLTKDRFQVVRESARSGSDYLVELIKLDSSISETDLVERGVLTCDHPLAGPIFCRSGAYILGPFTCEDCKKKENGFNNLYEIQISPKWGNRELRRMEWPQFRDIVQPIEISVEVATEHYGQNRIEISYSFFIRDNINELFAKDIGEIIDTRTDKAIIAEIVKDLGWTRKDKQTIKRLIEEINSSDLSLERVQKNKSRILEIFRKINRYEDVVDDLVDALLEEKNTQGQLEKAIARRTEEYITVRSKELDRKIEEQLFEKKKRKSELDREIEDLEEFIESEKKDAFQKLDQELNQKRIESDKAIKEKEDKLRQREANLERLHNFLDRFKDERERIIGEFTMFMPILEELGFKKNHEPDVQSDEKSAPLSFQAEESENILKRQFNPIKTVSKISEEEFISRFENITEQSGYSFDKKDLINFHICSKSEYINILAGPTGIGKSSLPRLYAKTLHGCADGGYRFIMVSVKPGWMDSHDLIGHFNTLDGVFQPSNSGLFEFLIEASIESEEGENGIFICCLDEMNLSYVEHYFSDFLSLLQKPSSERKLMLFSKSLCKKDYIYKEYGEITIPQSLRFCGTVNVDETTKFFSPKLIDRIHIIEITPPKLSEISSWNEKEYKASDLEHPISDRMYRSWMNDPGLCQDFAIKVLAEFEEKFDFIKISPRTYKAICRYISNSRGLLKSDEEAMDFAIFQKILPALRGHSENFRENLSRFHELCDKRAYYRSSNRLHSMAKGKIAMDFFNYTLG